jgi:hypothetical protein
VAKKTNSRNGIKLTKNNSVLLIGLVFAALYMWNVGLVVKMGLQNLHFENYDFLFFVSLVTLVYAYYKCKEAGDRLLLTMGFTVLFSGLFVQYMLS